jgi:preprotein translocase subunit SecE
MEEGEVAQSRRRNRHVEENLEEVVDGSADTDALDTDADLADTDADLADADIEADDEDLAEDVDAEEVEASESRAARKARKAKDKDNDGSDKDVKVDLDEAGPGIFGRFGRFIREVVAELRKVIWPTRKDLLVYTTVVIVFVAIMLTVVGSLDWAFARAVLWVFSGE